MKPYSRTFPAATAGLLALAAGAVVLPWCALAQDVTGELGSPSATITLGCAQLPPPDLAFGGVITDRASESTPWWALRVVPPKGAPNVLLIMTDDAGFAARPRPSAG